MRNPRREALLVEMGFYTCLNDCSILLAASDKNRCNGVIGVLLRASHPSIDCSEPSRLVEAGCIIAAPRGSELYDRIMKLDVDAVEYALRDKSLVIAVVDCSRLLGGRHWLECLSDETRYSCIESYSEIPEALEALGEELYSRANRI